LMFRSMSCLDVGFCCRPDGVQASFSWLCLWRLVTKET
jgi:hypothetical protein